eukprot:m.290013 g.290013  ORF g.290013 m.290013 type:complete len:90 (-) comp27117_c1_seq5:255-524(-)
MLATAESPPKWNNLHLHLQQRRAASVIGRQSSALMVSRASSRDSGSSTQLQNGHLVFLKKKKVYDTRRWERLQQRMQHAWWRQSTTGAS